MTDNSLLPVRLRTKLLEAVLEFMSRCDVNEATIQESFETALASVVRRQEGVKSPHGDALYIKTQNLPAQLLRAWHRDDRYTNQEAKPRPLLLARGRDSLSAAIRRIDPSADASKVLQGMKAVGLIRRTAKGRYLPTSESAIVDQLHPLMVEHVTKLISRLVSTVCRNTDPSGRALSLIDRHAYTPDLNPAERVAFAEFTRSHGMMCLQSVDDWLEQKRMFRTATSTTKGARENGVAAGVYLFAYLGDEEAEELLLHPKPGSDSSRNKYKFVTKSARRKKTISSREARA